MRVCDEGHAPAALPLGKRPVTHYIGGWVDRRAGLDGCGKSRLNRDSIPGPSSLCNIQCVLIIHSDLWIQVRYFVIYVKETLTPELSPPLHVLFGPRHVYCLAKLRCPSWRETCLAISKDVWVCLHV